jgi:hypothetical protein
MCVLDAEHHSVRVVRIRGNPLLLPVWENRGRLRLLGIPREFSRQREKSQQSDSEQQSVDGIRMVDAASMYPEQQAHHVLQKQNSASYGSNRR